MSARPQRTSGFPPIRRLGPADLKRCVALSLDRGWSPERAKWSLLLAACEVFGRSAPQCLGFRGQRDHPHARHRISDRRVRPPCATIFGTVSVPPMNTPSIWVAASMSLNAGSGVEVANARPGYLEYLVPTVQRRRANDGDYLPIADNLIDYRLPDGSRMPLPQPVRRRHARRRRIDDGRTRNVARHLPRARAVVAAHPLGDET